MSAHRFPPAPVSVVVDPGSPPYPAPWDLELRGPLDAAALERLLGELRAGEPVRDDWRHQLLRHGPDHHTLRFTAPQDASLAFVAGRVADRLTEPPPSTDHPLTPAQCAALGRGTDQRYEAMLVEVGSSAGAGAGAGSGAGPGTVTSLDAGALREALAAVVAAHPQLCSRLDAASGRRTAGAGRGAGAQGSPAEPGGVAEAGLDLLVEGEFEDETGFAALVESVGRTLDPHAGVQLRVLLARDRGRGRPRADRLAVIVHEVALDAASWRILLDDLTTALGTAAGEAPPRSEPDGLADWVAELRKLARDVAEAQHWSLVAEHRSRAPRTGPRPEGHPTERAAQGEVRRTVPDLDQAASGQGPLIGPDDGKRRPGGIPRARSVGVGGRAGACQGRRVGFVLDKDSSERVVQGLRRRLALTGEQLLTGVFALALARWQGTGEADFDVRSDPRAGRPGLRRQVGRLVDAYPVRLTPEPGLDALEQLTALAGPLITCAGGTGGGAGFGACREWSPDPELRRALRELPPARACLVLDDPGGRLPGSARPVPGGAPIRPAHPVEVRAHLRDGRLHVALDWVTDPAQGITDTSVGALARSLRELFQELAAAPAGPLPPTFRATPQQSALYRGGDARPGTGHHVEQLVWVWRGPLDPGRFASSWQSVFDRETVLRTAFSDGSEPLLMVHERVVPEITRRAFPDDWSAFLERDRLRGFDLRRPGALRLTLLETERTPTRILVTYHRALLDTWSAHLLLREFYRAYLAGGTLPGGERRPDLRDYTAWVAAQDPEPARSFWAGGAPPHGAASRPVRSAGRAGPSGVGRARLRLDPAETTRLARWAGAWGTAESSVLQAVWAMLIYRASGATGPAPVCFAVTVSGRGIALDGVSRMAGPLRNPLPMTVEVDPAGTVPRLLLQLRDHALDMASYEWVPADFIRAWGRGGADADTVIVFEDPPHPLEGMEAQLAAHGIHGELPDTVPARSVLPVGLLAHHDSGGGLVLTGVHDRAVLGEDEATELLAQSALLLRTLPMWAGESTTVGEALELVSSSAEARPAASAAVGTGGMGGTDGLPVVLRAARREGAGRICLIPPPGASETCYDLLARSYPGPQELLVLTAGPDAEAARPALAALGSGPSVLLAGFSGAGVPACDLARRIAADGGRPPRVVLAGACADKEERTSALARALEDATPPGV